MKRITINLTSRPIFIEKALVLHEKIEKINVDLH